MKTWLVTGAYGMLATDLIPIARAAGASVVPCDRRALDVTDLASVERAIAATKPDMVVQCAAYTNVDGAEADEAIAMAVNAEGARNVAIACAHHGAAMVYVSTDYVFDGTGTRPYRVNDPASPLGAYGRSKWAGEEAVRAVLDAHFIVRTAWLYGRGGKNFVDTMRRLGREQPELRVVNDQVGSPTWTVALSATIVALARSGCFGTYHAVGAGACSWYDFAKMILRLEGLDTPVLPITTADFPRPAARPAYSVLDTSELATAGVAPLPPWEASLAAYLQPAPVA